MIFGILVMITALSISAVAIYYSVSGLVAIFAAAAVPIMIMGGVLEIGKLVTAVWLHRYWHQAKWWLKAYLILATVILMFITSMGIFGFLSRAHIEQTASAQEGIAQLDRINAEIARQEAVIVRAEQRITEAEKSVGDTNAAIQEQIDLEQARIDSAYQRIQPAIDEQNQIIESARAADANRTEPFEQQLISLDAELERLNQLAAEYESRLDVLSADTSAIDSVMVQIATIEDSIIRVEAQLASRERDQIAAAQRTIGANPDGASGPNTRRAADVWISQQRERISDLQSQVSQLRGVAQNSVDTERARLTNLVAEIRGPQIEAVKTRQLEVLATIDSVRSTESPLIQVARTEIARIRANADAQIAQSNTLIQNLRDSLNIGPNETVESIILEQQNKIVDANDIIDTLTQQKYSLQAEYRKLEAEVGPLKYLAELIYGETDKDLLEDAVRWVIIIIIVVFDPLAVLLLIASQATFEMRRQERLRLTAAKEINNDNFTRLDNGRDDWKIQYARTYITRTNNNSGKDTNSYDEHREDEELYRHTGTSDNGGMLSEPLLEPEQEARRLHLINKETDIEFQTAKQQWKLENPNRTIKEQKELYILGRINKLPWEKDKDL